MKLILALFAFSLWQCYSYSTLLTLNNYCILSVMISLYLKGINLFMYVTLCPERVPGSGTVIRVPG